jgi:hypothetical protein
VPIFTGMMTRGSVKASPAQPAITYGAAEGQFTITNYDASLTYALSGCSRSGSTLSAVSNGATVTVAYTSVSPPSASRTLNVLAHGRILVTGTAYPRDCCPGPCPGWNCPNGWITDTSGNTYASVGTYHTGLPCGNGFQLVPTCWSWYWSDYSGSGYTQIGNTWGKAV